VEFIRKETEISYGLPAKEARTAPVGLGFRVPMIIASPWSRGGKVCSEVFDHSSTLQFLEDFINKKFNKNIKEDNISEWRRTVCGNLTSAFTAFNEKNEELPFLSRDPFVEKIYNAKFKKEPTNFKKLTAEEIKQINSDPASSKILSKQEPGTKPANSLPYQLYADGKLSDDKKSFELQMQAKNEVFGGQSSGSPFNVYAPGEYISLESEKNNEKVFEPVRAWHYAVTAGDSLTERFPVEAFKNGNYHLCVYGPNGFFREFMGNANDPHLEVACEYQRSRLSKNKLTSNIELKITNSDNSHAYTLEIKDHAYKNKPLSKKIGPGAEETIVLNLNKSSGWYDFSVSLKGNSAFTKRYAGRVETGKESISDPFMGRSVI
jgi:phospholipase C